MTDHLSELRISNDILDDGEALRARLDDEGYLFFKGLQNKDTLLSLRRQMLEVLQRAGWLVPGTDPMDGIARDGAQVTEGDPEYVKVYHEVYRIELFHRIAHDDRLCEIVDRIAGRPMMPTPHKVARLWFPKYTAHTTPVHQDFVHFQGSFDTLTCWAPVGDCPQELGGLAVLPGSHRVRKVLDHHFSLGAGGLRVDVEHEATRFEPMNVSWHTTDYEVGDTLFFPALTTHKALPNLTEDRLRVSLDNRYHPVGGRIAEHMLKPHLYDHMPIEWDEVYRDWENNDLKYYWRNVPHQPVRRYDGYKEKGLAEAFERAQAGDEAALIHLKRLVRRDPSSEAARRAARVLEAAGQIPRE